MVLLFLKHLFDFQQFLMQLPIFGVQLGDFFFGDLMRIGWFKISRDRAGQKPNDADAYDSPMMLTPTTISKTAAIRPQSVVGETSP